MSQGKVLLTFSQLNSPGSNKPGQKPSPLGPGLPLGRIPGPEGSRQVHLLYPIHAQRHVELPGPEFLKRKFFSAINQYPSPFTPLAFKFQDFSLLFPLSFHHFLYFSSHGLHICSFPSPFWLSNLPVYLMFLLLPPVERHSRTHLSSELDFFPVYNKRLGFEVVQRQIASDQKCSCVHRETGYSLGSWMTAGVGKSLCQSPSTLSPCDWHPPSCSLSSPHPMLIINPASSGSFIVTTQQD